MYSRHLFPYGGLKTMFLPAQVVSDFQMKRSWIWQKLTRRRRPGKEPRRNRRCPTSFRGITADQKPLKSAKFAFKYFANFAAFYFCLLHWHCGIQHSRWLCGAVSTALKCYSRTEEYCNIVHVNFTQFCLIYSIKIADCEVFITRQIPQLWLTKITSMFFRRTSFSFVVFITLCLVLISKSIFIFLYSHILFPRFPFFVRKKLSENWERKV